MRETYGGLAAQIVTPVMPNGSVEGIVSLHQLGLPRQWTDEEIGACSAAAARVRRAALMHNRWHPDLAPIAEVAPGEELRLETEEGLGGQFTRESTHADAATATAASATR